MCKKRCYKTFDEALKVIQEINRKGKVAKRAYVCWNCVAWHITSQDKTP
jgi:hypothetical protein